MKNNNLIKRLQERGLVFQITDEKLLIDRLKHESIVLYCGFDPTADSLHIGHLIPLLCLQRFQEAGNKPVILIGGATGLIGDPSFKTMERKLNTKETIQKWIYKIRQQVSSFLDFNCGENSAVIVNNYDWFDKINILTFLLDVGKYFSINQMINKEAVKQRLDRNNKGISFAEFSYNLLQGYDFAYLNKQYSVTLQIGGSDQWGNITSGIYLTRRLYKNQVFGLTVPLITKSNGTKFGKTENDTIWLDSKKTSPYRFYQFWINTMDTDVYRFLQFFTCMDLKEINILKEKDKDSKQIPFAKYLLAEHMTKLVHGEAILKEVKHIITSLFNNSPSNMNQIDFEKLVQSGVPTAKIKKGTNLMQALVDSKLQPSRGRARQTIVANAITINGKKQNDPEYIFSDDDFLFGRYVLLCCGKKNYCIIIENNSS